jgi:signal-transduction protein with cAMP-binding, CBS, and nucleotidyltransferase domain
MKVRELLEKKGNQVIASIGCHDSVLEAAKLMNEKRIGAVVVVEDDNVVGIFSERDVLRRVVAELRDPAATEVCDVMTSPCIIVHPDENLDDCQSIITQKRIRHLPVVDDGQLIGMITPGDIMAQNHRDHKVEIEYLHSYIYGARSVMGAGPH